ncbi:MAG: hypothetical protein ABEJ02_00455 [Candidatus Paceibacteria bacterium]
MNNILSQTNIGLIAATIAVLFSLWFQIPSILEVIFLIFFYLFSGYSLGQLLLPNRGGAWKLFFGSLVSISITVIILSVIYWFFQVNPLIISVVIVLMAAGCLLLSKQTDKNKQASLLKKAKSFIFSYNSWSLLAFVGYLLIFFYLYTHRSGGMIISPWIPLGWEFFIAFLATTAVTLYILQQKKYELVKLPLLILHFGVFFTIAFILYKHGFGFDPFIHQATERWIAENGFITPKKPYYIGQYVLVVFIHLATNIPISWVDSALVPVLATLTIPSILYFALKIKQEGLLLALLPLLLLDQFIVTTPNNFALLIAALVIFWLWFEWNKPNIKYSIIGLTLSLLSAAIHPFIGLPILLFYLGSLVYRKLDINKKAILGSYLLLSVFLLPTVLGGYIWITDSGAIVNPLNNAGLFLDLLKAPHWYLFDRADLPWQLLYYFKAYIWGYLLIAVSLFGFWKMDKTKKSLFYIISALGVLGSAFFLASGLNFSKVISYEETVFARRILDLSWLLLAPGFILGTKQLINSTNLFKKKTLLITSLSALLVFALYFTYPTRDPVSQYTGYNVRTADLKAVRSIDKRNKQKNYIVITNQMIGAAALKEFGFAKYLKLKNGSEHYFYSIPTGGELYKKFFSKMVYEEPKRKWMEQAMEFAGTNKAYFIHTNYWYPAAKIRDKAKKYADDWWSIEGKVWVYEYKRD